MPDAPGARIAIVGAGPAGLYAAAHLLEHRDLTIEIDLFERLPTPWGLVRAGVAPDHPEKKLIIDRQFAFVLRSPRLRFFGNVEIGADITPAELAEAYDAVIYAVGADGDVRMGVAGEDLPGSWSARQFVGFYNGHPDHSALPFDLSSERAVVVGNGNVALDVARILTTDIGRLERTDISDKALKVLRNSAVREVVVLGRRGPLQAAYNNPELEEFAHLEGVNVSVEGADMAELDPAATAHENQQVRRKIETLRRLAARPRHPGGKRVVFRFLRSPLALAGDGRVERLEIACNELVSGDVGQAKVAPTGRTETLEAGLVLRAVGYRGGPAPGLPFDEHRGVIPNVGGRVIDQAGVLPGVYATGWIKRGCNGIIGSNKKCAKETVEHLLEDLRASPRPRPGLSADGAEARVRARRPDVVLLRHWCAIDRAERQAGRAAGRPRVKITTRPDLLDAARMADPAIR